MIRTIDQLPAGARITTDIAIAGAGAAGITLALELEGSGRRVTLLEAGGLEHSDRSQSRYRGEVDVAAGLEYPPLDAWRLRQLGGTTNHWGGWCRPLEANTFTLRDWICDIPWPFDHAELEPYSPRAHELCEIGRAVYDVDEVKRDTGMATALSATDTLTTPMWRFSAPTRFGERYRAELEAGSVDVLLGSNCTGVHIDRGRAEHLVIKDDRGDERTVVADQIVLAGGAIENVRHLLLAADAGVLDVNRSGWLGRGFAEHPHTFAGFVLAPEDLVDADGSGPLGPFVDYGTDIDGTRVKVGIGLDVELLAERRMANVSFTLYDAVGYSTTDLRHGEAVSTLARILRGGSTRLLGLFARTEQRCVPESRLSLTDTPDDLGVPGTRLTWRVSPDDVTDIVEATRIVGRELMSQGIGPVLRAGVQGPVPPVTGGGHHMGGTRMHESPDHGVVDAHCRVHALDNLYLAGSSVFPTVCFSHPTLTVVMLAVRLAQTLRERA